MAASAPERPPRVALLGGAPADRAPLRAALTAAGPLEIRCDCRLSAFARSLARDCDALLVDLACADDTELEALERIAGSCPEPMLLVDGEPAEAARRVHQKLQVLLASGAPAAPARVQEGPAPSGPVRVWVLGASLGGPRALRCLLRSLPAAPAAALVIVQHLGAGFSDVLAAELRRGGVLAVVPAAPGVRLRPGRAYVMPAERRLGLDAEGRFIAGAAYAPAQAERPVIDEVMEMLAGRYGAGCGAIVLTGMGDDGARGAAAIARAGGPVWIQSPASCPVASMPEAVRTRVPAAR